MNIDINNYKKFLDEQNLTLKTKEVHLFSVNQFKKFAKKHSKKEYSVAVLSFYKEQAEKLKIKCKEIFNGAKNVHYEAGSVDSFQGHEADIVFLSYSNSHPTCFLEAPNRLNVAITRARYMMVHVGNWNAMSKAQGALGRIVQKLKNFRQTFN